MFDGWKYKTRFLIPPNGFCHTPCPITLKICLPRQEILAFSHFFSASRPPRLNILSCRSQQSSLLLCFPGYYVSIFFEFFSIIKPLKTMWSRFFPGRCSILGKNLRFENSGAELKMSREQQEVYIKEYTYTWVCQNGITYIHTSEELQK